MKSLLTTLLALFAMLSVAYADGERTKDSVELEAMQAKYLENLDEMISLWYVRQNTDSTAVVDEDIEAEGDRMIPEYPDSIYVERLSEINSLIDLPFNKVVRSYINVYTQKKRGQVSVMLGLAEYYFPLFEAILDQYQLPMELKVLPIVESALNTRAISRVGATGLWQFMYATGKRYNLQIDSYVDERRDPIASTHAAARFLKDLYDIFGDWTLALAAYNCGPGNVQKAIRRAGNKRDYWSIYNYLPRETRGYVPGFIAATYVLNYAKEHRITPTPYVPLRITDTVQVKGKMHLAQVSEVLDIPLQELRDLNPKYKHDLMPSKEMNILCLPRQMVPSFIDHEEEIRSYKDSIYLNPKRIREPSPYVPGQFSVPAGVPAVKYKVRQGDVLGTIAEAYGVSVRQLKTWNNLRSSMIRIGQTLIIYTKRK